MCDNLLLMQIIYIAKIILKIICYGIPPIVIIVSIIDISNVVISGKEDEFKDKMKTTIKRILAGLIVFILPTVINFAFTNLTDLNKEFFTCYESATKEEIQKIKDKQEADKQAEKEAEQKEQKEKYEEALEKGKERQANKPKEEVNVNTGGLSSTEFNQKISSMSTPTISQLEQAASSNGIDTYYLKIVIGTTEREGYYNDAYLSYGWSSAIINNPVTVQQMQGWDPSHSGDDNYYSEKNIMNGYNNASSTTLKAVYLALTERNTKIVECNGMYNETPSSYNKIYTSPSYSNISIYEVK